MPPSPRIINAVPLGPPAPAPINCHPVRPQAYILYREYNTHVCLRPGTSYSLWLFDSSGNTWQASRVEVAVPEQTLIRWGGT